MRQLDFSGMSFITSYGLQLFLEKAPILKHLEFINLNYTRLDDNALIAIVSQSEKFPSLRHIYCKHMFYLSELLVFKFLEKAQHILCQMPPSSTPIYKSENTFS